jgi:hypothetical protein
MRATYDQFSTQLVLTTRGPPKLFEKDIARLKAEHYLETQKSIEVVEFMEGMKLPPGHVKFG